MKKYFILVFLCVFLLVCGGFSKPVYAKTDAAAQTAESEKQETKQEEKKFIKWVDFKVPYDVLKCAYDLNIKANKNGINFPLIESLAYITCKNGNKFYSTKDKNELYKLYEEVKNGKTINEMGSTSKFYAHYVEVYTAIFAQFMGEDGLKTFHPIARGFWWSASDDFGNSRNFGFKRRHLGHDIWGSAGTPIMAIEGGTVAEIGWNRYGGWRIGIRSEDTKRYYYYAHLRKGKPYAQDFKVGDKIEAGQHIGYLGATGYSNKPDVNMKTKPHLHLGLQLIFDESQYDGNNEIWIDLNSITRLLNLNRATYIKKGGGE